MSSQDELRLAQEALVAALVAGAQLPPGFDAVRVAAATRALLRKRAGEVARAWPELARSYGPAWPRVFAGWASALPTRGSWLDGWDFARAHRGSLTPGALAELAVCEACWAHQGGDQPRRRRGIRPARFPGGLAVNVLGRVRILRSRRALARRTR
ncbi:MAG: hypothetical protein JWL58_4658 [Streptosporangiaceae bacterium]|jgi:hypothetical protein|nr:hypothetical protein [Streptosporangiaceae bacterium]